MKLLFHVQHMLGVGHRVRAERIAQACAAAGFDVTLMEGGVPGQMSLGQVSLGSESVRIQRVQLPPAKAADSAFSAVLDAETRRPIDDNWRLRRKHCSLETLARVQPDVLLVEGYPFARRAFQFELDALVMSAKEIGARTAVSIRDILVARTDRQKTARIAETARRLFDAVLVHGDPNFVSLNDSFSGAHVLADRIHYTGLVTPSTVPIARKDKAVGDVIVSAGGGAVGGALLRVAVAAKPLTRLADNRWRILMGPNLPDEDRAMLSHASAGIEVEETRSDFLDLLASASLSISQAGYNTVADLLVAQCPAVLVPFEGPNGKETEQPARARLLAEAGRAAVVPEPALTAETLARAVDIALTLPAPAAKSYQSDGAAATAHILKALCKGKVWNTEIGANE